MSAGSQRAAGRPQGRHLVLVGPTAAGKSSLAVEVARRRVRDGRPTEIVSCDSMAVYRGMDVGTATPGAAEQGGIPHHLLDVVDPSEEFSVRRFVDLVDTALDDIEGRGSSAVLVGGTGLYVQAVVDGLDLPGRYPDVAAQLETESTEELERHLGRLDPLAAERVPPGNRRRLVRALEVTIGSGTRFSASGPGLMSYGGTPFVLTGLIVDREQLTERITARYRRQLDAGFVDEVRTLGLRPGGLSRTAAAALGYRELSAHLQGELTLDEAVALVVRRTRRFAVRQERWFRRDPRIRWFTAPGPTPGGTDERTVADGVDAHWRAREAESAEVDPGGEDPTATVGPSCCD